MAIIFIYSFTQASVVHALPTSPNSVIINEFKIGGDASWVELYNATSASVDMSHWILRNATAEKSREVVGNIESHGFKIVEVNGLFTDSGGAIYLLDSDGTEINAVAYGTPTIPASTASQSTARKIDGGALWANGTPSPGETNVFDILAPSVPSGGQPNETVVTTRSFNFSWEEAHDNYSQTVRYELRTSTDANQLGSRPDTTSTAWYSSLIEANSLAFQTVANNGDGTWYWQVRSIDDSGNKSPWSETWHVLVDSSGPTMAIQNPNPAELFGGPGRQLINFAATIGDVNGVKMYDVQLDGIDKTKVVLEGQPMYDVTTNGTFSSDELEEGDHLIRLSATDYSGNQSELYRGFTVDKTAPSITTTINDGQKLTEITQIDLTITEAHPDVYRVEILKDGKVIGQSESGLKLKSNNGNILKYEWDTSKVDNGNYQLQFSGIDRAGNESNIQRNVIVNNFIAGSGGILTEVNADSLLDRLSKELSQPFLAADTSDISSYIPDTISTIATTDKPDTTGLTVPETDRNAKSVVAPTEHGWRIFGVLWFWWALLALAFSSVFYRWRRGVERSMAEELT